MGLPVRVRKQEQTNWCWCAVAVGVCAFYDPARSLAQCKAAARVLGIADACSRPGAGNVNTEWALDDALRKLGEPHRIEGTLDFQVIKAEIDARRPVPISIMFLTGRAHFAVIKGYRSYPPQTLLIADPKFGDFPSTHAELHSGYPGSGFWQQSFLRR
jgi:hypothetical protein